jgi:DNA replication protein DnaC
MTSSANLIQNKFLSDSDADRLYESYPELRQSADKFCPTCATTKSYVWQGETFPCDCDGQRHLYKHYLNAGIGVLYQRLTWDDYQGDEDAGTIAQQYRDGHLVFVNRGLGLLFLGPFGTGKTMIANLLLKDLVKLGYRCFGTTFASMISMFTSGWKSLEEQQLFEQQIKNSQILLLDDVGKEFKTKTNLAESTFDDVLRTRIQAGRPTFMTTNMNQADMQEGYGSAVLSLLQEVSITHTFAGNDFRQKARDRSLEESLGGEIRPIV